MNPYTTIKNEASFEYEDRKSIFIATAAPVSSEEQALDFIAYVKKKYPDARHHVYAYVLRENSIMRFSDDREPQGTAGMPVLDAIRKNGCTDTAIVVIRYFGGTLLGTGGLVRAYSSAAIGALEAAKIITYDIYASMTVKVSYSDYQKLIPIFNENSLRVDNINYTDSVIVEGRISKKAYASFEKSVIDITGGRGEITILKEVFDF